MRTNIQLDEKLVKRGMEISGIRTKKDLVNAALEEFVRRADQKAILELRGKIPWKGNLADLRSARC